MPSLKNANLIFQNFQNFHNQLIESLILNGKEISYDDILKGKFSASTPFGNSTLKFSREWLSGKSDFSIFTSGSTGKPKEIILHRDQMIASARMTGFTLSLKSGDRSLVCLNTEYIAGMMMLVRGFELDMSMTIIEPASNPLKNIPSSDAFDFTAMVPMQMQKVLEESQDKIGILNNMKAILLGGSPVSARLEESLQQISSPVFSSYGMTETVSHIALRRLNGNFRSELYTIIEGVKTGIDARGCLTINAPSTRHHTIITNDLVELTGNNTFRWLGRIDNVINSGGIKIHTDYLEEKIDRILHEAGFKNRSFVSPISDEEFGEIAVLIVEGNIDPDTINKILREKLKKFEVPKRILAVEKFTDTATQKIDKIATGKRIL
jgi:o-succinylbenzoate---CoA ligase